ncbi:putative oxidoreductase [Sphingobium xanthum]|jgi:putative oxidoreductase|uniref:DoxX family protein n=1 Tax=Sphingobium xanthum TaxID=1387165 RepID=UPI001C8C2E5B|nr:DoxX family protein [Sphingobium xanthum]
MSSSTVKLSSAGATVAPAAVLPFVGRLAIAAIFVLSGVSKVADPAGNLAYIQSVGLPFPQLALAGAILVEIVGGALLVLGYRTRLVAAGLALFSIATALFFHADLGDQNQFIHFFKNIAMAGGLAQIVAFGAGGLSLDARR